MSVLYENCYPSVNNSDYFYINLRICCYRTVTLRDIGLKSRNCTRKRLAAGLRHDPQWELERLRFPDP